MKIIVVGGGKVGTALCRSLVAENHDVILIEKDESVLNHITKRFDIIGILGNGQTSRSWSKRMLKTATSLFP